MVFGVGFRSRKGLVSEGILAGSQIGSAGTKMWRQSRAQNRGQKPGAYCCLALDEAEHGPAVLEERFAADVVPVADPDE